MRTKKIYWFEPIIFIAFGLFHMHRIWAFVARESYATFWLALVNQQGIEYFLIMIMMAMLCLMGIVCFICNRGNNYWWRWIYLFGGSYVLFDLTAIATKIKIWRMLLQWMFDVNNSYWNELWGFFVSLGLLSFLLGICLIKKKSLK